MEVQLLSEHEHLSGPQGLLLALRQYRLRRGCLAGTHRLMLGVLEEAIRCYWKYAEARNRPTHRSFREVYRWIESTNRRDLFAFETICDVLDLDARAIRRDLRGWRMENPDRYR